MANTKKTLTPEQEKQIKLLKATQEMLEKTKNEAKKKGKSSVSQIEEAEKDIYAQINDIDKDVAQTLMNNSKSNLKIENIDFVSRNKIETTTIHDVIESKVVNEESSKTSKNIDMNVQYDVISLPSNGECYSNKLSRLPVAYLTAYDENILTSPNLYKDGLVIDFLLKNKILKEDFDVDGLCSGDADAITLFLRATSYGVDFPVSVRDPKTGKEFDTVIDLSKLKYKEFNLKADENGYFSFTLPLSKDEIKFKYLSRKENKQLDLLNKLEIKGTVTSLLERNTKEIITTLEKDEFLTESEKIEIHEYVDKIKNWANKVNENSTTNFSLAVTNKMEMEIQSVNGNTDRVFIHNYIKNMRAKDSMDLRRYISQNEPGIDFSVEVERPEEFGGGSFKTFLEWDDTLFLNYT